MNLLDLTLMGCATWRMANMMANEKGPFLCFWRLKHWATNMEQKHRIVRMFHLHDGIGCEYCNSVWWGTLIYALYMVVPHIVLIGCAILTLSTIAIFLKKTHEALGDIAKVMIRLSLKIQKS